MQFSHDCGAAVETTAFPEQLSSCASLLLSLHISDNGALGTGLESLVLQMTKLCWRCPVSNTALRMLPFRIAVEVLRRCGSQSCTLGKISMPENT